MHARWIVATMFFMAAGSAPAATWQFRESYDAGKIDKDGAPRTGEVFAWLPPESKALRGLLIGGKIGIELELALDPGIRKICAENDIGIVYFTPHISGLFHYWTEGATDAARFLKALDDLAVRAGRPEIRRVPWITMGHSTAGIFCRNVAYWQPERVAGILHIRSGNLFQKDHLPPKGSLAGVPLLAINGQFETFGPEGGIRPEFGRETQFRFIRKDLQKLQELDGNHLAALFLDLGGDHFHGSAETAEHAGLFLRKVAQYRLPKSLPPGREPVRCLPIRREDGWLSDADFYDRKHAPAPFGSYTGDKSKAWWHFDEEIARASDRHHKNAGKHQCLSAPNVVWLDEGDGWTFEAKAEFLDVMPAALGGSVGGIKIGHAKTPIHFRGKATDPVEQVGPNRFRALRPTKSIFIAAINEGDDDFRPTNRWSTVDVPMAKGQGQTIDFAPVGRLKIGDLPFALNAKASSGLPIYFEVEYGPIVVKEGKVTLSELPSGTPLPIGCRVTAHQIGRRSGAAVSPAVSVTRTFELDR